MHSYEIQIISIFDDVTAALTVFQSITAAKATVLTRFSQNLFLSCLPFSQGLQLNISVQRHQPSVRMTVEKAVKN